MTPNFTVKIFLVALYLAFLPTRSNSQAWRGLVIYTDSAAAAQPGNFYENLASVIFPEINGIYSSDTIAVRAQIAGVIRDQTHYVGGTVNDQCGDIYSGTNGMDKYIDLLAKYSADILFLVNPASDSASTAATFSTNPLSQDHGSVWLMGESVPGSVWAHEVGHNYGLTHCDGYRQTYDVNGDFSHSSSVTGFNTIMAHDSGDAAECSGVYDDGENTTFATYPTLTFSNPSRTWTSPVYPYITVNTGTPIDNNSAAKLNDMDPTVRAYHDTPSSLTIADTMSLAEFDYADFLSTGGVTIEPGFNIINAKMNITTGSMALSKRGIKDNEKFIREGQLPQSIGKVSNFTVKYNPGAKSMVISFSYGADSKVELSAFDIKGNRKGYFGEFKIDGQSFFKTIDLNSLANGTYFVRAVVGSEKIYTLVSKR